MAGDPNERAQWSQPTGLAALSPGDVKSIADSDYAPTEADRLNDQLLQAIALRQGGRHQHSTPGGAIADALGDLFNDVNSRRQEKDLRGKLDTNLQGQKGTANTVLQNQVADVLARQAAKAQALRNPTPQATPPTPAPPLFPAE